MSIIDRTRDVLRDQLANGEILHAATQAQLDGGTMRLASRVGAGAAGGAIGVAMTIGDDADELGRLLANGLVLAVTDRRVILLDVTAVAARPKSVVANIDRAKITDVVTGDKRVMLVKLSTLALSIGTAPDEQILRFEIPKTARSDAEAVAEALRS